MLTMLEELVNTDSDSYDNIGVEHTATGGGSDSSFTANMGIPTLDGLGPVGGKQHSQEEYLEIDSLLERTHLFINVLKRCSSM